MLEPIRYIDRATGKECTERVYGENSIRLLYGSNPFGALLCWLTSRFSLVSSLYGWLQRRPRSKKKIAPFVERYGLNSQEFVKPLDNFDHFDDFFTRKLKAAARPLAKEDLIIPADGRYWVSPQIDLADGFLVKGKQFNLAKLLGDEELAKRYSGGAMVMARLCPTDYHRFHFPCDGTPGEARSIPGRLYSVNPVATRQRISIFSENKRVVTPFETPQFGQILIVEVGATCVGTIHQTYTPGQLASKGDEKGYFSFGGSSLLLLFEPGRALLSSDLLKASARYTEVLCKMGSSLLE